MDEKDTESPGSEHQSDSLAQEEKTDGLPSFSEQREIITPLLRPALKAGDSWYLLDLKWYHQWQKFVGFDRWNDFHAGSEAYRPGPINLSALYNGDSATELREHMVDELDYFLVPAEVWEKFVSWYGLVEEQTPIKRHVVEQGMFVKHCRVEVYLLQLKLALHGRTDEVVNKCFSRADTVQDLMDVMKETFDIDSDTECRVWNRYISSKAEEISKMTETLMDAGLYDDQVVMIEPRNADGIWPMGESSTDSTSSSTSHGNNLGRASTNHNSSGHSQAESTKTSGTAASSSSSAESSSSSKGFFGGLWPLGSSSSSSLATPGLCGLSNLGNTCFMNSALQCLSNTPDLTGYFLEGRHQKELNKDNPLGMRGLIASAYGDLLGEMWGGRSSATAPRSFKYNVGKFAPQFSGYAQHDSQELLAFLMDGLHEDLNRIKKKPYVEVKDSGGRPDKVVAKEAWENHMLRNDSIIVDTFQGQFKSTLDCPECKLVSVTFDPFMFLQVPLPIERTRRLAVTVVYKDLSVTPLAVRVVVPKNGSVGDLLAAVTRISSVDANHLVLADVYNCRFHKLFKNTASISSILDRDNITAYEISGPISETSATGNMSLLLLYLRREKKSVYGGAFSRSTTTVSMELFGRPQMLCVPRAEVKTYAALHSVIQEHMKPIICSSDSDGAPHGTLLALAKTDDATIPENVPDNKLSEDSPPDGNHAEEDMEDEGTATSDAVQQPIFSLHFVNTFGSYEIGDLTPASAVKLASETYVSLDWKSEQSLDQGLLTKVMHHSSYSAVPREQTKSIHLLDCVDLFLSREQLGEKDPWYCPRCKEHRRAFKKFDLWMMPKVLVIQLKRFSYNAYWRDKIDAPVQFPVESLDLSEYCKQGERVMYDLHAVSNHYGGMGGGHYTAYAKNKDNGCWYHFDDSSVKKVSVDAVQSRAAYVLFYTRRDATGDTSMDQLEDGESTSV